VSDDNELNGTQPTAPEAAPFAAAPKASSDGFLSTTAGRVALIVGAIVVLLVLAGIVGWFVLGPSSLGGSTGTPGSPTIVVSTPPTVTPSVPASSTVATLPVAPITSRDVFTPRNPFTVIKPATIATATSDTNGNSGELDPTEVFLTDITGSSPNYKAVIAYGGHTYTLSAGDLIPGTTDWKILSVHAGSAVVLFGDVSVTLTPGQGTSK
jgi:hypothetical protein